jgi:hypothetical protein
MSKRALPTCLLAFAPLLLCFAPACDDAKSDGGGLDANGDFLADDLGTLLDANGDGAADSIDIDKDGKPDGFGVDTNGDGTADALALDTDCDGVYDSLDTSGDGKADLVTGMQPPLQNVPNCNTPGAGGMGGAATTGGAPSAAGSSAAGGSGTAGSTSMAGSTATGELGKGIYQGTGSSQDRYAESDVFRNGVGYMFIANGWGDNWKSHDISYNGTSFTVKALQGSQGANYSPAGYPTIFCGQYSEPPKRSNGACGLPAELSSLKTVKTGWRWKANGNSGQYNAAWDIWLGNGDSLSAYLMVWLRDPPGQQPAGAANIAGVSIEGLPGQWSIYTGSVNGHPIVNYVRAEGQDLSELEFDVMKVYADAKQRNFDLPGNKLLSIAIGFEIWNGPVANLVTDDFYVDVN